MHKTRLIALLSIGLLLWGGYQYFTGRQREQGIENHYYCAFYELSGHLAEIENELGKAMVSVDPANQANYLLNAHYHALAARLHLEELPILPLDLSKTILFLRSLAEYTRQTVLDSKQNNTSEPEEMADFMNYLTVINAELEKARLTVQNSSVTIPWVSGFATAIEDAQKGHPAAYSLVAIEEILQVRPLSAEAQTTSEVSIDKDTARRAAVHFLTRRRLKEHLITVTEGDEDFGQTYTVEIVPALGTTGERITVAVTKSRGDILWMLSDFVPKKANLSIEEALDVGQAFLQRNGLVDMVNVSVDHVSANYLIASFSPLRAGAISSEEQVKLRIELEQGLVIGYDASAYLNASKDEIATTKALLSVDAALGLLHSDFTTEEYKKVLVSVGGVQRIAYEFAGTMNNQRYLVYIDAKTGKELEVKRIRQGSSR
ncbi:MAG: PepSY1/2 domain-containing protein [Limnochordia bacterium]